MRENKWLRRGSERGNERKRGMIEAIREDKH